MNRRIPRNRASWAFALAILAQVVIVLAIPLPKAMTLATGTSIFIETRPIDPYDLLRGRYVTLGYLLESESAIAEIPGYLAKPELETTFGQVPDRIYFIMEPGESPSPEPSSTGSVVAWEAVEIKYRPPQELGDGQQVLAAQLVESTDSVWVDLELDSYFIPETIGDELEADIREHPEDTLVEVKVDRRGNSALVGVWVEDRQY